jgi:ribosomal protein S18 acetylase RimI-like enzyme
MVISAEIADGRVLICRIGAEIAGMASADCRDGETFLSRLYVRPGCQGRGIGSLLLDAVLREAPGRVVLTVLSGNERARALYERPGFREQSRRPDPDGGPEHVRMVRLPGRGAELAFACAD